MAINQIEKLIEYTEEENGTYAIFEFVANGLSYTSDSGKRRSTKTIKIPDKDMPKYEEYLYSLEGLGILTSKLDKVEIHYNDKVALFEKSKVNEYVYGVQIKRFKDRNVHKEYCAISRNETGCVTIGVQKRKDDYYEVLPYEGGVVDAFGHIEMISGLRFWVSGLTDGITRAFEKIIKNTMDGDIVSSTLLNVFPCSTDGNDEVVTMLRNIAVDVCNSYYPFFKNTSGTYVSKYKIMMGTDEVTRLFSYEMVSSILGQNKYWFDKEEYNASALQFLKDIGIIDLDGETFLNMIFQDDCLDELAELLDRQPDRWLRRFYIVCAREFKNERIRKNVYSGLKNIKCIRDTRGKMYMPSEISIAEDCIETSRGRTFVKRSLISPNGDDDNFSESIRALFVDGLKIGSFSLKDDMMQIALDLSTKKQSIDEKYIEKLYTLAFYDSSFPNDIDFSVYKMFPYESARGISRGLGADIVIGKPFIKEGDLISKALGKPCIWKGIKQLTDAEICADIISFAKRCGAVGSPVIVRQSAFKHLEFAKRLKADGKRSRRDVDVDYTILGLDELLKRRSLQLNKLVWQAINEYEEPEKVLYAEYSVDNRNVVNKCDSSLIQILRQRTWVPDKNNKLHAPGDIKVSDISEDFNYNRRNPILKALLFGSNVTKQEEDLKRLEKLAQYAGMHVVDENEYKEFIKWKNRKKK